MPTSMDNDIPLVLLVSGFTTLGIQILGFIHGYALQTEHFYDALGGFNSLAFIGVTAVVNWQHFAGDGRKIALTILFGLSRLWLLGFLAWRARERKGDGRFDELKPYFFKFFIVWMLQAMWVFGVAMPLLVVNGITQAVDLNAFDYICVALFALGLICQVAADIQKARWVAQGRTGGFCQVGLWHFSRHPNYFGEMLMWWCAWALTIRLASNQTNTIGYCFLSLSSPIITTLLLLFVSGLPLAEGSALKRYQQYPDFAEYRASTSILIPMVGYRYIPMWLKRTLFCEFRRYEYKPSEIERPLAAQ